MSLRAAAPVIVRGPRSVQVGIRRPLVLSSLSGAQMRFLASLEGGRRLGEAERRRHRGLLECLEQADLLTPEPVAASTVRFRGAGAIAVEAATVLARLGWAVAFEDAAAARDHAASDPIAPGSSYGIRAAQRVRRAVPGAQIRGAAAHVDLDVLVAVGLPLTSTRRLLAADAPHLVVACDERGATVGPVLNPGSGPCVLCLGLHLTAKDPQWPRIALQCEVRQARTEPVTAGIVGMLVARLAQDFVAGRSASAWRVDEDGINNEPVPDVHPECGCAAA